MKYEFKKLILSKGVWICLAILLSVIGLEVYIASKGKIEYNNAEEKLLNYYAEKNTYDENFADMLEIESQKMVLSMLFMGDKAYEKKGEFGDTYFQDVMAIKRAADMAQNLYVKFPEKRSRVVRQSLKSINIEKGKVVPDESVIKLNELAIEKYNKKIDIPFKNVGNVDLMLLYFDNSLIDYVMIIFVIMITVRVILSDVDNGSFQVIYTSRKGRKILLSRQLATIGVISIIVILLQTIVQLLSGYLFFGVNDLSVPIQSYQEFEMCPFNISLGTYILIKSLCKILFLMALAAVTTMVCVVFRKSVISMIAMSVGAITVHIFLDYLYQYSIEGNTSVLDGKYKLFESCRIFILDSLLNLKTYFNKFDYTTVLGVNVFRLIWEIVFAVLTIFLALCISYKYYGRERRVL